MRRKDTPKQEAKEEVKKELPEPTAKDDGAAKDIATALLAQSENTLEIIATLIKSHKMLESHAIVMDNLIEAAQEKAVGLETELAQAKSLAVAGGPKRTAQALGGTSNDLLLKAATYKAKANAATDPDLAKGYKALADKYYAEASTTLNK